MKKILLILVIISLSNDLLSQTKAITTDGKEVILLDTGTWKYTNEKQESEPTPTIEEISDCSKYIMTEEDKVTGTKTTTIKEMLIVSNDGGKNGFGIYILQGTKSIIFSIKAIGAGSCIDDTNKMNILFRDGSRLELTNDGKFNCDSNYTQYFGGVFRKTKELEMLKTKEVEIMRIWTSKSFVEETFTSEQSKVLLNTTRCLAE
jgi:hypothetical protein